MTLDREQVIKQIVKNVLSVGIIDHDEVTSYVTLLEQLDARELVLMLLNSHQACEGYCKNWVSRFCFQGVVDCYRD